MTFDNVFTFEPQTRCAGVALQHLMSMLTMPRVPDYELAFG